MDTGLSDQVLWNFIHHNTLVTTLYGTTPQNWFGFHFSPVLLLLAPFYTLWPHLELLQLAQSACFAVTGLALFYALKAAGANNKEAWVGSILYWINPFVLSAAIWDFHEICFAAFFIGVALWALCAKRFTIMLFALTLLLLCKEHYGLSIAGFGLLWGVRYHEWKRACIVIGLGLAVLFLILFIIMPALHGGTHFMFVHDGGAMDRYSWMHTPWPERIATLYHLLCEQTRQNISGIAYIFSLLLSSLLLPLAAIFYIAPAGADLLANLLSSNASQRSILLYHSATIIPIFLVAAHQGYTKFGRNIRKKLLWISIACLSFITCTFVLPLSFSIVNQTIQLSTEEDIHTHIRSLLSSNSVSAQTNIGMFFSQRTDLYPFPEGADKADAAILYLTSIPLSLSPLDKPETPYHISAQNYLLHVRTLLHNPDMHITYWQKPWLVIMRGKPEHNEDAIKGDILRYLNVIEKALP